MLYAVCGTYWLDKPAEPQTDIVQHLQVQDIPRHGSRSSLTTEWLSFDKTRLNSPLLKLTCLRLDAKTGGSR